LTPSLQPEDGHCQLELGNVVIGLGGDTLLMTRRLAYQGIAYRCAKD
jgi:hypothetical protein